MRIERDFDSEEKAARERRRTRFTATELLDHTFPEPRFAVPGLIAEGLTFFCGPPKLGKSWFGLNLSIAVASGGRALGAIPVEQGEVLYLALEDPPRRLQQRLRTVLGNEPPPNGLHFETEWPRFQDGGDAALSLWLSEHPRSRLVIVDVFAKVRPPVSDRADRYNADYAALEPLKQMADRFGIAVVVVHHTRKAAADDFVDTVSGTNGLAGASDSIMILKRSRGRADATLSLTGRDVEEQELALRWDQTIGTWTLLGDADQWSRSEPRRNAQEALRAQGPLSPKQLSQALDISHDNAKQLLRRMAIDGHAVSDGQGHYSLPHVTASPASLLSPGTESQGHIPASLLSPPSPNGEKGSDAVTQVTPIHGGDQT